MISLPRKWQEVTPESWLKQLYLNLYPKSRWNLLRYEDSYSAFGIFLDMGGVDWVEHPHSPGVFQPAMLDGSGGYDSFLPDSYLDQLGEVGELYKNYRFFSQLSKMPFPAQAKQIEGLLSHKRREK